LLVPLLDRSAKRPSRDLKVDKPTMATLLHLTLLTTRPSMWRGSVSSSEPMVSERKVKTRKMDGARERGGSRTNSKVGCVRWKYEAIR
jgi:hypothetical protein